MATKVIRLCDRCGKEEEINGVTAGVYLGPTGEHFDFCDSCAAEYQKFLTELDKTKKWLFNRWVEDGKLEGACRQSA